MPQQTMDQKGTEEHLQKKKNNFFPLSWECKDGSMCDGMNSELKISSQVQVTTINLLVSRERFRNTLNGVCE